MFVLVEKISFCLNDYEKSLDVVNRTIKPSKMGGILIFKKQERRGRKIEVTDSDS